jgi:hypothetical protein
VSGAIQSALAIVDLCQTLQHEVGLARASYTEFTTCRAALLVILAQRMYEPSARLKTASARGVELLRHMSLGFYSDDADKYAIQAMETAIQRLDTGSADQDAETTDSTGLIVSAYDRFRNWAMLWKNEPSQKSTSADLSSSALDSDPSASFDIDDFSTLPPLQDFVWDMDADSFAFDVGDEFAFPRDSVQ